MRRLVLLTLVAIASLTLSDPSAVAETERRNANTAYSRQAFAATNAQRADEALAPLRKSRCLQRFARAQAQLMAQREEMFHQSLGPVLTGCGLARVGENVAYGYRSGQAVVDQGWMNSEGHRANILDPGFTLMAIGARKGRDGRWYVAQVFGAK